MSLRQKRNQISDDVTKGKFISNVLKEEGTEINLAIDKSMASSGFTSTFWNDKSFTVKNNNTLEYRHKKQHRFVDMKTRKTNQGSIRKKRHVIHDKIIYGHLNNIARQLSFGYTQAVIDDIKKIENNN